MFKGIIILFLPTLIFGQEIHKIYFKGFKRQSPDSASAAFYIIDSTSAIRTNDTVVLYYPDGRLYAKGKFESPYNYHSERTDLWKVYYKNGNLMDESFFIQGKLEGISSFFRENSKLFSTNEYKDGILKGQQLYYYNNNSIMCNNYYFNNQFVTGTCFDSLGNKVPHFVVEKMPEFPGGISGLQEYIRSNVIYPRKALIKRLEGKVLVSFIVDKSGLINDVHISQHLHPLLDEEAIRVVKLMPTWSPGTMDSKAVKVLMTIPIKFKLQ